MDKEKWLRRWSHQRNLLSRGHTEVSLFYAVIQFSILVWLALRDILDIPASAYIIFFPLLIIVVFLAQYFIGYLMDRYKLIDKYQEWDAERNPYLVSIKKQTKHRSDTGIVEKE